MKIPNSCLEWIKLQRSGYKNTEKEFQLNMQKEYVLMMQYLPEKCNSILDIGCGIGGIDVILYHHFGNPALYLLDNSKVSSQILYGFDRGESFYNSFQATKDLMDANAVKNYMLIDSSEELPDLKNIDLVLSILSWGYHYPIGTYLSYVDSVLSENGTLIMDIREWTDGVEEVKQVFPFVKEVSHYNKSKRIAARRTEW